MKKKNTAFVINEPTTKKEEDKLSANTFAI